LATVFVIAGPNGAGKSTNSKVILDEEGITAFDYDIELFQLWSKFSFDPVVEDGIRESVNDKFLLLKEEALINKTSFAFETNYNQISSFDTVKQFGESGHKIILIFILLPNVGAAIERVKTRVANGGHSVSEPTIKERFANGLTQLDNTFVAFDEVYIYLSKEKENSLVYTLLPKQKRAMVTSENLSKDILSRLPKLESFVLSVTNQ
jgi:predicted ABC-type ATPase